ncbi:hypothetical protein BSKO_09035 [Bryopsis sp. KO-2023]|nr:hypothetical protein BSKO_09035 [Bryopsis sp. KO-2023]
MMGKPGRYPVAGHLLAWVSRRDTKRQRPIGASISACCVVLLLLPEVFGGWFRSFKYRAGNMRYTLATAICICVLALTAYPAVGQEGEEAVLDQCQVKGQAAGTVAVKNACRAFLQKCNPESELPEAAPDNLVKNNLQKLFDETAAEQEDPEFAAIFKETCTTLYSSSCSQAMTTELSTSESLGDCVEIAFEGKEAANCQDETIIATEWGNAVESVCSVA